MDEWKPIKTVPRDGTRVLATWKEMWPETPHIEVMEAGEEGILFYTYDGDRPDKDPSHWMPIPPEPGVNA